MKVFSILPPNSSPSSPPHCPGWIGVAVPWRHNPQQLQCRQMFTCSSPSCPPLLPNPEQLTRPNIHQKLSEVHQHTEQQTVVIVHQPHKLCLISCCLFAAILIFKNGNRDAGQDEASFIHHLLLNLSSSCTLSVRRLTLYRKGTAYRIILIKNSYNV